jgi:hypothetical protein
MARFERVVIDADFPGAYQVEVADVNGDGRPDIVALGGGTCAWYENPSWTKRIISTPRDTPGIISTATADLDSDGKAEVAIAYEFAMSEPKKGKLAMAIQTGESWSFEQVGPIGSIHRLRWGDVDGDGKLELVVAPIFGPDAKAPAYDQSPARIMVFRSAGKQWNSQVIGERPVLHAIEVRDFDGDGRAEILTADNLGVAHFDLPPGSGSQWTSKLLVAGAPGTAPKRGSSEIHFGHLSNGTRFLATIDPWHGTDVAVYQSTPTTPGFSERVVLDSSLHDGHALWVADVDGDGDDEIFAGYRGPGTSLLGFDFDGVSWRRIVLDEAIAAQDLRGGDLDANGIPDLVAVGGKTHNVVWYRPIRRGRFR